MNEINWHHPKNSSISWLEVKDTSYTVYYIDLKTFALNIKPCMGQISGTWELLLCEY
jgi:hypothetical protein